MKKELSGRGLTEVEKHCVRPSSSQYFPVEGTNGAQYTLWDPILFTGCV